MTNSFAVILAAPPEDGRAAAAFGRRILHLAYRIDPQGRLIRPRMPSFRRGDLMAICHTGPLPAVDPDAFLTQLLREYTARNCGGVVLDPEGVPDRAFLSLTAFLDRELRRRSLPLWVPLSCAGAVRSPTRLMLSSAVSGGNYREMLAEQADRYGPERLILQAERNCEDFLLPAADGCGQRLSLPELNRLFAARQPTPFFSRELCTWYFTYRDGPRNCHFVLFDNGASLRRKLQIAAELGIPAAVLAWPEIADLAQDLLC